MAKWKPTTFLRYVKTFQSSSYVALIETDAGPAYLKAINNPEGVHILACDWLGTQLAARFGLPTFDVAILEITEFDEIPLNGRNAQVGPAYITRGEQGATMGTALTLESVTNLDVLARMVLFDTWMRNCDRHGPEYGKDGRPRENLDNLFLSEEGAERGKFILKPIDFGHIINCGRGLNRRIADIDNVRDERVYGLFPFFQGHVTRDQIIQESTILSTVNSEMWNDLIEGIPEEWEVDKETRIAIGDFLKDRARFLAAHFPHILPVEPEQAELGFSIEETRS
jgi:hypothetical protein